MELPPYQLLIRVAAPVSIEVGRLGHCAFAAGRYVYTGSARRNAAARIARHLSKEKAKRWHVDYLLALSQVFVLGVRRSAEGECRLNARTAGSIPARGFGSSDCRARCGSHLKFLGPDIAEVLPVGVTVAPATEPDAELMSRLALDIWRRHYLPGVLRPDEVDYFWRRLYSPEALVHEMRAGVIHDRVERDGELIGFLGYQPEPEAGRLRLNKLYLLPECHGQGIGAALLARIKSIAAEWGLREVYLYVFRRNGTAVRAYRRAGFVIEREEVFPFGEGYSFDDYVMVCPVEPLSPLLPGS